MAETRDPAFSSEKILNKDTPAVYATRANQLEKNIAQEDISTFFRFREAFLLIHIFMLVTALLEVGLIIFIVMKMMST